MWDTQSSAQIPAPPLRVFLLVLVVVFLAEMGVMIVLPRILPSSFDRRIVAVIDSGLLTMISAPILWYVIIVPLRRWEREAVRAESLSAIGQLATGVAHEVRNPLTSIKMLVQSNLGTVESPALREDLKVIEDEIRRMESTLNTFLEFARPRAPNYVPLDLSDVVQRTLSLLDARLAQQVVQVEFEDSEQPLRVQADAEQLRQILLNLSLNALEMMPQGGTLTIRIQRCRKIYACVQIADTGPGVASENISRLFEPFFTTRETGVGLGLVISRRIAKDHGGDLLFQNRSEGGACFTVQLPLLTTP